MKIEEKQKKKTDKEVLDTEVSNHKCNLIQYNQKSTQDLNGKKYFHLHKCDFVLRKR